MDVVDYKDIEYQLLFKGINNYSKNLAKTHKPTLTRIHFQNELVIYNKCWFTTNGLKGMDISDIELGKYEL